MKGITDLKTLLARLQPILAPDDWVFVTRPNSIYGDGAELEPIASMVEEEGLTLIVTKDRADAAEEDYQGVFRMIKLQVHSSLHAVGLTATVADALSKRGISANIVAAFYHDHVFVPSSSAHDAIDALTELTTQSDTKT